MWAWIIPIIISLIEKFLIPLIEKWLGGGNAVAFRKGWAPPITTAPPPDRTEFLNAIKRRWWLGPRRMQYAESMFDKAAFKYMNADFFTPMGPWKPGNAENIAKQICANLRP